MVQPLLYLFIISFSFNRRKKKDEGITERKASLKQRAAVVDVIGEDEVVASFTNIEAEDFDSGVEDEEQVCHCYFTVLPLISKSRTQFFHSIVSLIIFSIDVYFRNVQLFGQTQCYFQSSLTALKLQYRKKFKIIKKSRK